MAEEELAITVRWKRPTRRTASAVVGMVSVAIGAWCSGHVESAPVSKAGEESVGMAREWRCVASPASASFGVTEERLPGADKAGGNGTAAETASGRSRRGVVVLLEEELTRQIIKAFYRAYDRLGYGRLESVYRNAMVIELRRLGVAFVVEQPLEVWYDGQVVGAFRADIVVDGRVVVELKAGRALDESAHAQVRNYLACSDAQVGLLLYFGQRPEFFRFVDTRNREREPSPR
ncbi:MAG TPA: GxxExxY protein [Gemmatimonadaceae bacterium]|nr:GxxExxY protein [Gemmatimonadaceae bacterium]